MKVLAWADIDVQKIRLEGKKELQDLEAKLLPASTASPVFDAELVPELEASPLLLTRVRERTEYQEAKRQLNIEQVALEAANELRGKEASAEPLDEDWVARFFESAKDVSSEEMQRIWAKILAGEVVRPGSFSVRCIEAVRNISREEAALFEGLSPYVVGDRFILRTIEPFEKGPSGQVGDALLLAEAGLLTADAQLAFFMTFVAGMQTALPMSDLAIMVTAETQRKESLPAYALTGAGRELMRLFPRPADRGYARALVNHLRQSNYRVETFLDTRQAGGLSVTGSTDIFPVEPLVAASTELAQAGSEVAEKTTDRR
jgi:hypothetical protein